MKAGVDVSNWSKLQAECNADFEVKKVEINLVDIPS